MKFEDARALKRVNNLPLATIYEVKIPLRKWKKSLLQRNPAQMTWHNVGFQFSNFIFKDKLKAFSNEINPNPNIFLNRPPLRLAI
jgi:hypothetical protein